MKIKKAFWSDEKVEISVPNYVRKQCDGCDYDRGAIEEVEASKDKLVSLVGNLLDLLNTKGIIDEGEIEDICRWL